VPRYIDLLRAGGPDTPRALLSNLQLDIGDPDFWNGGLALLEVLLAEAEELASTL